MYHSLNLYFNITQKSPHLCTQITMETTTNNYDAINILFDQILETSVPCWYKNKIRESTIEVFDQFSL